MSLNIKNYLNDLSKFVNMDSPSDDKEKVNKVASFLESLLTNPQFKTERIHYSSVGDVLLLSNDPKLSKADKFDILICGHMDTVFPSGTAKNRPFSIEDNLAKGPGVIDDKSPVLSAIYMLNELSIPETKSICLLLNSEEESGSKNTEEFIKEMAKKSRFALVTEPARPSGELVSKRKGLRKFTIDFFGKGAHSGNNPQDGISAVIEMASWILKINNWNDLSEDGITFNTIVTKGGVTVNTIPDRASILLEARSFHEHKLVSLARNFENLKNNPFIKGININFEEVAHFPAFLDNEKNQMMQRLIEEVGQNIGVDIRWLSVGGCSNASHIASVNCPVVDGLGPIGGGLHSVNEYMLIDSIIPRYTLLLKTVEKLLSI